MAQDDDFYKQNTQPGIPFDDSFSSYRDIIPSQIGPYKIESLLEKGGMSLVYLGTHPETKDPLTIKVLLPELTAHPEAAERFFHEAQIIEMTSHPNIVKLYGQGEWEGNFYIAMEFIQGISLRQFIQHHPISLKKALEIVLDIAYALCHLHTYSVIHRDLKPENILLTESGVIKVIDFGIAQLLEAGEDDKQKHRFAGTPFYMSPEQRKNPESVTYSSDIYSLGIIAYELILGKLCHGQVHLSLLPKGLQKIFAKALQPLIEDRYQDVVDFITDLSAYLNSGEIEKEKSGMDHLGEISEQMYQVHELLAPHKPPSWHGLELGFLREKRIPSSLICTDFVAFPGGQVGFFTAQTGEKGILGAAHLAQFKGMMQSLIHQKNPQDHMEEFFQVLNELTVKEADRQNFSCQSLILYPERNRLEYLACGEGQLFYLPAGKDSPELVQNSNPLLGVDLQSSYREVSHSWSVGDSVLLANLKVEAEVLRQAWMETPHLPAQKQADALLRKVKALSAIEAKSLEDRLMMILVIHRLE